MNMWCNYATAIDHWPELMINVRVQICQQIEPCLQCFYFAYCINVTICKFPTYVYDQSEVSGLKVYIALNQLWKQFSSYSKYWLIIKGVLHLWALFLKTLFVFSKTKQNLDKVSYGSGQKCSTELKNHSFTSVEAIVVKLQRKMCENQYFPCFEP